MPNYNTDLINTYLGVFAVRDQNILQSITELYAGPYIIEIHQLSSTEHRYDTHNVDNNQTLQGHARCYANALASSFNPEFFKTPPIIVCGGKPKLHQQLTARAGITTSYNVLDHVEMLFLGQGSRALSLCDRTFLSNIPNLRLALGAEHWFTALTKDYEKHI